METENYVFVTPQFKRTWKLENDYIPKNAADFIEFVTQAPIEILKQVGFCLWDDETDDHLYLLPGEWYNIIPEKYLLTSISGRKEKFKKGKTDNDIRFGCLVFGVIRKIIS